MKLFKLLAPLYCSVAISPSPMQVLQMVNGKIYNPVEIEEIDSVTFDIQNDFMRIHKVNREIFGYQDTSSFALGERIPLIEIVTKDYKKEITSKTDYSEGFFSLEGLGKFENVEQVVNIRGRGNSSWYFTKKPYRLKFKKKVSLLGLPASKNYVLLANYTDCSLMQNALAFKIGEMLQLPFTNRAEPVDVNFNGLYKGSYILTNKPGINAGSVDIDEENSIMWELDEYFDEDLKFKSPLLGLPVMVADPDLDDEEFKYWKNDFVQMEKAVYEGRAGEFIDLDIAARYLAVYEILKNDEVGYPKSFKMFKTKGSKYILGPIWDFDIAMGKVWLGECYTREGIDDEVWKNSLIYYLSLDANFQISYRKHLNFIIDRIPELLVWIDNYAVWIRESALRNRSLYPEYEDFDESVVRLKSWLIRRGEALKRIVN